MKRIKIIAATAMAVIMLAGTGVAAAGMTNIKAANPANEGTVVNPAADAVPENTLVTDPTTPEQQTDEYSRELRKFFTVSGTDASFPIMMETMIEAFEEIVPADQMEVVVQIIRTDGYEKLLEMFTPVYRKYISLEELKEINKFYETPAGKRLADSLPKISADAMTVGQEWGAYLLELIMKK